MQPTIPKYILTPFESRFDCVYVMLSRLISQMELCVGVHVTITTSSQGFKKRCDHNMFSYRFLLDGVGDEETFFFISIFESTRGGINYLYLG